MKANIQNLFGEKIFSLIHTSNLTYTTCWEDPRIDRKALNLSEDDTVLTITSGGCNSLDYLLDSPKHIYSVDLNPHQGALLQLKLAGIRELDFGSFFELFGKGRLPGFKRIYWEKLRRWLTPDAQNFWDRKGEKLFDKNKSFYFRGTSGSSLLLINFYIDRVAKIRLSINKLFNAQTLEEQQEIYETTIRQTLAPFMRRLLSSNLALWMNCVPPQQRQQVEQDFNCDIGKVYERWIEVLITQVPIKDNYFLRLSFTGEYSETCCPEYLKQKNFVRLKDLISRVSVVSDTVDGFLQKNNCNVSRFVLLDHMDWLSTYRHEDLISEWQNIVCRASNEARVIFRSMLSKVDYLDDLTICVDGQPQQLSSKITMRQDLAKQLNTNDRAGIYGSFYIADIKR